MASITIEKTKYECAQVPKRWQRDDVLRKTGITVGKVDLYYGRGVRNDGSLVPPIRQTASIFKQPVTVYKLQESKVKNDYKNGNQEKPKQLIWEKRLEGLRACDMDGFEFEAMELPKGNIINTIHQKIQNQILEKAFHMGNCMYKYKTFKNVTTVETQLLDNTYFLGINLEFLLYD
ncbi:methyl-CpG-binding domain protein 2 isoform X2 [Diorhabda sublineata]|uniref:methyl-CpG-binding domain protein 2 isoform X2 n=1 Tax=Diorhabda sublineata TaxID=1163346 RepID=UPI0024E1135B|nr:methyl-CpG-binding domain protein 2 isoform X2 [Diorhabda sublineata]